MVIQQKLYTADELYEMAGDIKFHELVKGILVERMPTGDEHTILAVEFATFVRQHVRENKIEGYVTGESGGYKLEANPDTVRAPDIGFISKERAAKLTGKYFTTAPDLAIEIMSPNDTPDEVEKKIAEYFAAGTQLIWIVHPKARTIRVHLPDGTSRKIDEDGILDGGDVLPGFRLAVRDLFAVLDD